MRPRHAGVAGSKAKEARPETHFAFNIRARRPVACAFRLRCTLSIEKQSHRGVWAAPCTPRARRSQSAHPSQSVALEHVRGTRLVGRRKWRRSHVEPRAAPLLSASRRNKTGALSPGLSKPARATNRTGELASSTTATEQLERYRTGAPLAIHSPVRPEGAARRGEVSPPAATRATPRKRLGHCAQRGVAAGGVNRTAERRASGCRCRVARREAIHVRSPHAPLVRLYRAADCWLHNSRALRTVRRCGMANSQAVVSALYAKVVSDVIAKSRVRVQRCGAPRSGAHTGPQEEFLGEGLDATVLEELRVVRRRALMLLARRSSRAAPQRWERKLAQSGVAPTVPAAAAAAAKAPAAPAQTVRLQKPGLRARSRVLRRCSTGPCASSRLGTFCPCGSCAGSAAAAGTATSVRLRIPSTCAWLTPCERRSARDEPLALLGRPHAFLPAATGWITETEVTPAAAPPPAPPPSATHAEPSLPQVIACCARAPAAVSDALLTQDAGRKRKAPDSTGDAAVPARVAQAQVASLPPPPVAPGTAPVCLCVVAAHHCAQGLKTTTRLMKTSYRAIQVDCGSDQAHVVLLRCSRGVFCLRKGCRDKQPRAVAVRKGVFRACFCCSQAD